LDGIWEKRWKKAISFQLSVLHISLNFSENLQEQKEKNFLAEVRRVSRRVPQIKIQREDRKTAGLQDYLDLNTATNPPFLAMVIFIVSPDFTLFSDFFSSIGSLSDCFVSAHISIV